MTDALGSRARRLFYALRTQGRSPAQEAWAVGVGAFIGCTPLFGLHLPIAVVASRAFRLNPVPMYLAAQVSNPIMLPALLAAEIQVGAWLRRGDLHAVSLEAVQQDRWWMLGGDLLLGALVIGSMLGIVLGVATYAARGRRALPPHLDEVLTRAADRYQSAGMIAWEFARGKLRGDPVYRALLAEVLPEGGTLLDIGCGQGLMLATLIEAQRVADEGRWPGTALPPRPERLVGIETRRNVAEHAQRALGGAAEIVVADARGEALPSARVVLLLDVLHLMRAADQQRLVQHVARATEPGGVVMVREVDAGAGWGFQTVKFGNRLKALLIGRWREQFHFRTRDQWRALFGSAGFDVAVTSMGEGTPFANVLFRLTRR